jgi:hypothetical protein
VEIRHEVSFALALAMSVAEATDFARDVARTLRHADFLADLQVVAGDPPVVSAAIPVSAAMFGQRELPFRSVLVPTPTGARLEGTPLSVDGPGWALVSGEARVSPAGPGRSRIDYGFDITVHLRLPRAQRWGERALTRVIEYTARTVLTQVAGELKRAVARAAGVATVVA